MSNEEKKVNEKKPVKQSKSSSIPTKEIVKKETRKRVTRIVKSVDKPKPIIRVHVKRFKKRQGKGFSLIEMKEVGIDISKAKKFKLRIDPRRTSNHPENVNELKKFIKSRGIHGSH